MKNRKNSHDTDDLVEALRQSGTHCIVLSDADRDLFLRELLRPRPRPREGNGSAQKVGHSDLTRPVRGACESNYLLAGIR